MFSQNNISFEATANAKKVAVGSVFEVTFTLKNARGTNFRPPKFGGFQVISGPSQSMSTQIYNGRMTQEISYSFSLMPNKVGNWTIGAASIQAGSKTYKSKPLQIKAVKGAAISPLTGTDKECFIRAEPSTTDAYIGQQVLVDYKLYTIVNIENYSTLNDPEYPGFFAQNITRFNNAVGQEDIDGVQYTTKILKRVALFPQQAGILPIEPLRMQLGIEIPGQRSTGFFFRKKTRPVQTTTNPVEISVRSLPPNAPNSFNGAVGEYDFQASIKPTSLTTDDAVRVMMRISGNGDLKRLQPPTLAVPDKMEVYDPSILDESEREKQGELTGTKTLEYLVLPKAEGRYNLTPEFTYFSPDSVKYVTLKAPTRQINVRRGTGNSKVKTAPKQEAESDIRFIKLETNLQQKGYRFFGSLPFWILALLPIFGFTGALVYQQILNKKGDVDLTLLKSNQASKVAQKRLSTAKKHLDANASRDFYNEISRASLGYIGDKLNIPNSEMTKNNVREKLQALQVSNPNIDAFMKILQTSEMALFAGMDNSAAMSETFEKAMKVVVDIEEEIG
jgi:hypothetical protein